MRNKPQEIPPQKNVWDLLQLAQKFTTGKEKQLIVKSKFLNSLLIHVPVGSEIPAHYEDYEALFYIIEGSGEIQIGTERIKVKPGMLVLSPKELLRGIFPDTSLLILGLQELH